LVIRTQNVTIRKHENEFCCTSFKIQQTNCIVTNSDINERYPRNYIIIILHLIQQDQLY
jgi:hypothetical protein